MRKSSAKQLLKYMAGDDYKTTYGDGFTTVTLKGVSSTVTREFFTVTFRGREVYRESHNLDLAKDWIEIRRKQESLVQSYVS